MYKICSTFDSTDRGNIGPVTEALAAAMGERIVPVTPAFPGTGRRVFQGHLFVNRQPLNESPLKDHPLNPMRDSDLTRVLERQSRGKVGLVPFEIVEQGEAAITDCLERLAADGNQAAIIDSATERHLVALGAAAIRHKVTTGASGLGLGLARAAIASGLASKHDMSRTDWEPVGGKEAILAGSCSAATRTQIERAEASMPVRRLDIEALTSGPDGVAAALDWAAQRLDQGPVLLASSAAPDEVERLKSKLGENVGARIEEALAAIAEGLIARGVRRLVVAGGETSGAVADRLAIKALEIGPELAPGVPLMRRLDGADKLLVAGTLVGASGTYLTMLMAKAMGRSVANILFGALKGGSTLGAGEASDRPVRSAGPGSSSGYGWPEKTSTWCPSAASSRDR